MKTKVFLMIFTLSSFGMKAQDKAVDILNRMYDTLAAHKSVSYDVVYKDKVGLRDSNIIKAKVKLMRVDTDSYFQGYIWFSEGDTEFQLYNNLKGYDVRKNSKTIIEGTYKPRSASANAVNIGPIWKDFLRPGHRPKYDNIRVLDDTIISGTTCWHIVESPPDMDFIITSIKYNVFISKKDFKKVMEYDIYSELGQPAYHYTFINNVVFDLVKEQNFSIEQLPESYKIKKYMDPVPQATENAQREYWVTHNPNLNKKILDTGTLAQQIKGKNARDGKDETIQFNGAITILDFGFMACPPCVEAIRGMDSLKRIYENKGVLFYGVDCVDTSLKDFPKFQEFVKAHNADYPFFMVSHDIVNYYNTSAYPTIFIIGKDGKVKYCHCTVDFKKLATVIDGLVKEE